MSDEVHQCRDAGDGNSTSVPAGTPVSTVRAVETPGVPADYDPLRPDTSTYHGFPDADPIDVHMWFSLTYANYLVWPRSLMQSMPESWQRRFVAVAREIERAYPSYLDGLYRVQRIDPKTKRYMADPVPDYNRGRTFVPPEPSGCICHPGEEWHHPVTGHCGDCGCFGCSEATDTDRPGGAS